MPTDSAPPPRLDTYNNAPPPSAVSRPSATQHGFAVADVQTAPASSLTPAITPATTTRQSVPLGVLSTLWAVSGASTTLPSPSLTAPAIVGHASDPGLSADLLELATSAGSVPSATTTLTNTLPPTQSAALRALNAPAFQHAPASDRTKSAKSASSRTTLSSQPVVVRTYSGSRRHSRHSSSLAAPRHLNMGGLASRQHGSAWSNGFTGRTERLPPIDDFSFSAVLRAVDPEIRDAIDAIAEICARSRLSLADEYDAHLPPQGEITGTGPGWVAGVGALVGRGNISRIGHGWNAAENTLTAVPEASSSSERLAGEIRGTPSSKKRSQSAYGSLKSVISGGSARGDLSRLASGQAGAGPSGQTADTRPRGPTWTVDALFEDRPAITIASPQASNHLSLDTSSTIKDIPELRRTESTQDLQPTLKPTSTSHRRNMSLGSLSRASARPGPLSSITSWLPWPSPSRIKVDAQQESTKAETRLREVLMVAQGSAPGKGKAAMHVA